jgi:hypothetical protein
MRSAPRERVRFVLDSPLEEAGFEPPVPREKASSFYAEIRGRAFRRRQPFCERAEASNLPPHRGFLSALNLGSYRQTSRWVCGAECGRRYTEPNRGPGLLAPAHVTAFAEGEVRDAAAPDLQCAPR